ncbi:HNH endonuclease [Ochrobactrum sp. RH2CCR150]|uniref:HNH endonuclease n=1 Tax=Ochrobactrum sp. RH2CCR150 TaxID=2587044 RepID=UPI00366A70DF
MYKTSRWTKLRQRHLDASPLCVYCLRCDEVEEAKVVDHIRPHKGSEYLFFDPDNLQSLCAPCHDRVKSREELGQTVVTFGVDGYPIE